MAAATLSAQAAAPLSRNSARLTVTSNQAQGTVYAVVTRVVTAPSHAQVIAGQTNTGAVADWAGSAAGALSNSFTASPLIELPGSYYAHFTQINTAEEASTVYTTTAFKCHSLSFGTLSANGATDVVILRRPHIRASGGFGGGTITFQYLSGDGTWVAIKGAAWSTADQMVVDFERPAAIRGSLTGATNPTLVWEIR